MFECNATVTSAAVVRIALGTIICFAALSKVISSTHAEALAGAVGALGVDSAFVHVLATAEFVLGAWLIRDNMRPWQGRSRRAP